MARQHIYDSITTDLAKWLNETPRKLAGAVAGGSHAPFSAALTEAQKLAYYRSKLFNKDGTPNLIERQKLIERAGISGYARVMNALAKPAAGLPDHPDLAAAATAAVGSYNGGSTPNVPQEAST